MKNVLYTLCLLLLTNIGYSEQTFVNESAILEGVYYGVPTSVEIVEHDFPTDYYLSIGSGTTWEQVSSTFEWGDSRRHITWKPTFLASSLKLGIHTGARNSGTFSVLPTDQSDATFDIQGSSITFNDLDEIWWDDIFYLSWESDKSTLPESLLLEYRESGGNWTIIDTISSNLDGISIHNEFSHDNTDFRLTYLGSAYGYTLGSTSATFLDPSFIITNKSDIEFRTWGDNQNILIEYDKERLSEYTYILAYVNGEIWDSIGYNKNASVFTTEKNYNGSTIITFVSEHGDLLETLTITSKNKWFELSPLTDEEYTVNSNIPFHWSYSDDFILVETFVKRNNNTTYTSINEDWELSRQYNYAVLETDTVLTFMFIVSDGTTEVVRKTKDIYIGGHCRENELLVEIDSLNSVIDSLENIEPEYIMVTLIKDIPTGIDKEYVRNINDVMEFTLHNGILLLDSDDISHLYIIDMIGNIVYDVSGNDVENSIDVSRLSNGLYIVVYFNYQNTNPNYLKFVK